jgi:pilus assembly protein Flp/PilA
VKNNVLTLFTNLQVMLARVFDEEEGQGLTEYALILALIAIIAIAALSFLGGKVTSELSVVGSSI